MPPHFKQLRGLMRSRVTLALLLVAVSPVRGQGNSYVVATDRRAALNSAAAVEECGDNVDGTIDREAGRKSLEAVAKSGKDNLVYNALSNSKSVDEIGKELFIAFADSNFQAVPEILIPRVLLILVLILWPLTCCSIIPTSCCDRCGLGKFIRCCCIFSSERRCNAKQRQRNPAMPLVLLLALGAVFVGVIVFTVLSIQALRNLKDGANNGSCGAAGMLNSTIGDTDPSFLGFIGLLDIFWSLQDKLGPKFGPWFKDELAQSASIASFMSKAETSMLQLKDLLRDGRNINPKDSALQPLYHTCEWCLMMDKHLDKAIVDLKENSYAALLVNANLEIQRLLDTRSSYQRVALPVKELMGEVIDNFEPLQGNEYADGMKLVEGIGYMMILGSLFGGLVLVSMGIYTWSILKNHRDRVDTNEKSGHNPYTYTAPTSAASTWCCGCCFTFIVLLLGTAILTSVYLLSSACIMVDDLTSETLRGIGPAINLRRWSEGLRADPVDRMLDRCFNPPPGANLLDASETEDDMLTIIELSEDTTGGVRYTTLRDKFAVIEDIRKAGARLAQKETQTLPELGTSVLLENLGFGFPAEAMLVINQQQLDGSPLYKDMGLTGDWLGIGFRSSASCYDYRGTDAQSGDNVVHTWGISEFFDRLNLLGEDPDPSCDCRAGCISRVICNVENETLLGDDITIPMMMKACEAGNHLLNLKRDVRRYNSFWCEDRAVDLAGFVQCVKNYEVAIKEGLDSINAAVLLNKARVEEMLLRARRIVEPVESKLVASRTSCSMIAPQYQKIMNGYCYQAIYGLRVLGWCFVALAILTMLFTALYYLVWRFLIDNVNHWEADYMI